MYLKEEGDIWELAPYPVGCEDLPVLSLLAVCVWGGAGSRGRAKQRHREQLSHSGPGQTQGEVRQDVDVSSSVGFHWFLPSGTHMLPIMHFLRPCGELPLEKPLLGSDSASQHHPPLPADELHQVIEPCAEDDAKAIQDLQLALFIFNAVLVITVILSGFIYARLRGHIFIIYKTIVGRVLEGPKPNLPVDEVQYDAFLSFSENDYGWVEAALLKKLDNQFSEENLFRCCFEARDFLPGEDHLTNIRDAIWSSRKTVCVVSKEFLKDGWCLEAFTLAQGRMLEELTDVLVMVVVGKMAHYQLMKYQAVRAFVQRREYLTWPEDPQDLEWFYERLVSKILKDTKVKKFAEDQPEPAQPGAQPQEEEGIQLENIGPIPCQL
ncbi:hypothetical protein CesoFtcFv8_023495 [Champsocephalus esox]|uniref:TIR domain-containing protein n=1 Tax=Champsocephalus esox TaxID=159716 RepID=A0AAN8B8Y7_9TELE|nr:hypothetical protein CesoFtcFv8_023495 [Champsocephalus esox]